MTVKLEEALKLVDEKRIIQLASEVISIPSITGDEKKVMEYAKGLLEELGVGVEVYGSEERPILYGCLKPINN